jgi:hypothetical protein
MGEVQGDPKSLLHVPPHEKLKGFALTLLTQGHDLFIPWFLLNGLVHASRA